MNFSVNAATNTKRRKDVRVLMEICLQLRTILDGYEFFLIEYHSLQFLISLWRIWKSYKRHEKQPTSFAVHSSITWQAVTWVTVQTIYAGSSVCACVINTVVDVWEAKLIWRIRTVVYLKQHVQCPLCSTCGCLYTYIWYWTWSFH